MKNHILSLLFSLVLFIGVHAEERDSTHCNNKFSIVTGVQLHNRINTGLQFYNRIFEDVSTRAWRKFDLPTYSVSAGIQYNGMLNIIDFSYRDINDGSPIIKSISNQFCYDFLYKKAYVITPIASISFNAFYSTLNTSSHDSWGGYVVVSKRIVEKFQTYSLHLPIGIYCRFNNVFLMVFYNYPLYSNLRGKIETTASFYQVTPKANWETKRTEGYRGNSFQSKLNWESTILSMRIGYKFGIRK